MLSSAELAEMQSLAEETFDRSADIVRNVLVDDGAGGSTETPTVVATVNCRLTANKTADNERVAAGMIQSATIWRITMPVGTDVQQGDVFNIDSRGFEVVSLWGPHTFETALIVLCVERAAVEV